jgi:serine/threonine-protein kinase
MSISIPNFWALLQESRLLTPEQCQQLAADFGHMKGANDQPTAKPLAEWLVARNVLSRYQTMILLAGRPGPFFYGDYKVYDRVEKGRLTGNFRAVHGPTGHPVMLQFLTGAVLKDQAAWAEACQNALAAGAVQSPFVQRFFEPVDLGSFKFVVSEDLRGASLEERLAVGRFPPAEACRLARHAALGLAQLHASGRAHGDVRPANLFLDSSVPGHPGDVKLLFEPHTLPAPLNFAQADSKLLAMSDYLAPELMHAGRAPDPLSDIYALGCSLYHLLAGTPPFPGDHVMQKMTRHATEGVRPLEPLGVPQPLAQLVMYLLAKNPQVRYQSAAIVAEQLTPFIDPSLVYSPPIQPLPTQAGYEHWIAQKLAQQAARQPAAVVRAAAPAEPQQPAFSLNVQQAGEAAATGKSSGPLAGVSLAGVKPAAVSANRGLTPQELQAKREKAQLRTVVTGLVGVGALAIGLLVVLYVMNSKPTDKPGATDVAQKSEEAPVPVDIPRVESDLSQLNKVTNKTPNPPETKPGTSPVNPPPRTGTTAASDSGPTQQVVADDGELLWASPTAGKSVDFKLVPLEGQVFFVVRPAALLATTEGPRVLEALGPQFSAGRTDWERRAGLPLSEIDQLIITLHNNNGQFPRVSYVVHPKTPIPSSELLSKWGNPTEAKEGNNRYFTGANGGYYMTDAPTGVTSFLLADAELAKEAAASGGGPTLMQRDLERLRRSIDGDRHVSILFNPDFFDNEEGQALLSGPFAKVRPPLDLFLGDTLEAGLVSMQFDSAFYFEFRMLSSLDRDPFGTAKDMRERLGKFPDQILQYVASVDPPPYWKLLSFKIPGMVDSLYQNLRVGVEGNEAIVNAYLPGPAAHNLVLGGELLIASAPGAARVATGGTAPAAGPKTLEEALKLTTSISLNDSLEFCMRDLAIDFQDVAKGTPFAKGGPQELQIKIIGADLEKDGITRNQQVRDFKMDNKSFADILTAVVMKANPVTTVKTPDEPDQKLLWVVGPDPDNPSKQMILITTRAAAATKKYTLPAAFQAKGK